MSLTSLSFLLFVAIIALIYYVVPKSIKWIVLLAASYAFYLISSPKTLIFIVSTTVVTFFGGKFIDKRNADYKTWLEDNGNALSREEKKTAKAAVQKKKKAAIAVVLLFNFGVLAAAKYFRYYLGVLGLDWALFDAGILIPLGISFYTFQSAAYIIDIYRSKIRADQNIFKFALFLSFFPLLIQGPISRHDQLAGQLYEGHEFSYKNFTFGAQLILWGCLKKLVIADRAAILVNQIFDNYTDYNGVYIIIALLFYSIQIYGDFSGGIDISRGVAQILGIELVNNFQRPYFSDSLSEFWRRWHITLGNWCRDYIFYPISLSKIFGKAGRSLRKVLGDRLGKLFPVIIAQMATFIVIGIWHGAELKFIVYGLYNGLIIVAGLVFEPYLRKAEKLLHIDTTTFSWKLFKIIRTFMIVVFGRVFPKAASFGVAVYMIKSILVFKPMVLLNGGIMTLGLVWEDFIILGFFCIIWFIASLMAENGIDVRLFIAKQNILVRWGIYIFALVVVIVFGVYGPGYDASTFIYRGF